MINAIAAAGAARARKETSNVPISTSGLEPNKTEFAYGAMSA
jgi:hypothetical protein